MGDREAMSERWIKCRFEGIDLERCRDKTRDQSFDAVRVDRWSRGLVDVICEKPEEGHVNRMGRGKEKGVGTCTTCTIFKLPGSSVKKDL
jgi:hypothetical protein